MPFFKVRNNKCLLKNKNFFIHNKSIIEKKITNNNIKDWVYGSKKSEKIPGPVRGLSIRFYTHHNSHFQSSSPRQQLFNGHAVDVFAEPA